MKALALKLAREWIESTENDQTKKNAAEYVHKKFIELGITGEHEKTISYEYIYRNFLPKIKDIIEGLTIRPKKHKVKLPNTKT